MERIEAIIKMVERTPELKMPSTPYKYSDMVALWDVVAKRMVAEYETDNTVKDTVKVLSESIKGCVLMGTVGTGKTTTMRIFTQCHKNLKAEYSNPYQEEIFMSTRMILAEFSAGGDQFLLRLANANFLCIDDLGSETPIVNKFGTKSDPIATLLFLRYEIWQQHKTRTYATSNLNKEQLKSRYGERLYDRMREMFTFVVIKGESKRK